MRRSIAAVVGICTALSSTAAFAESTEKDARRRVAQGRDAAEEASEAYCRHARAVAASQSAVMISPQLFVSGGMVTGSDASGGASAVPAQPRLLAGANFSAANVYRGVQTGKMAEADCARMRLFNKLYAYTAAYRDGVSPDALAAKASLLEQASPRADEILKDARAAVADGRITVDELDAILVRVDAIRAMEIQTRGKLRAAAGAIKAPAESIAQLLAARDSAERAAEGRAANLRQSYAWDVSLRGGYDQVFGFRSGVPVFGMVTVSFNPGLFWQRGADDRAEAARVELARKNLDAAGDRAFDVARQLREVVETDKERLAELTTLLSELEARQADMSRTPGDRAKVSGDLLWLALVPLRAEHAYLRVQVAELSKVIAGASAPSTAPPTRR